MPSIQNSEAYELSKLLHLYSGTNSVGAGFTSGNYVQNFQRLLEPVTTVTWYYMDDLTNTWQAFSSADSVMLDNSRLLGEQFFIMEINGETSEFDFLRMVRRNINTGVEGSIDRRSKVTQSQVSLQTTSNKGIILYFSYLIF